MSEFTLGTYVTPQSYTIAAQIAFFRRYRGMTQEQLAKACDMQQEAIARLEKTPDIGWSSSTLSRLAGALDVRVTVDIFAKPTPTEGERGA